MKDQSEHKCSIKDYADYLRAFPKADSSWLSVRQEEPRLPLLTLPADVFQWDEKLIYTAEFAWRVNADTDERLLFLRVLSFDPAYRTEHPEIDFCIPMAYDGASERERLSWPLWPGAWSDTREEFTLLFGPEARDWLGKVLQDSRLVLLEQGQKTASLVTLRERDMLPALKDFLSNL